MTDNWTPEAARERLARAREKLSALCNGRERFTMTIPVRLNYDHDVIFGDTFMDLDKALDTIAARDAEVAQLRAAVTELRRRVYIPSDCACGGCFIIRAALHPEGETL